MAKHYLPVREGNPEKNCHCKGGSNVIHIRMFGTGNQTGQVLTCDQMLESHADITLFRDLSHDQIAQLDPLFEPFSCPPGTTIFEQGVKPTYLYILLTGKVIIRFKPYDGPSITVKSLKRGDVFGWSAVVGSKFYTSTSMSVTQVEAFRIRDTDLWDLVHRDPETGKLLLDRLASVVASRWKNAHTEVQILFDRGLQEAQRQGGV